MVVDCYLVIKDDLMLSRTGYMLSRAGLYKRHVLLIEVTT